jgi:Protein of unknown function (DUF4435)
VQESITPEFYANEIRMRRSTYKGAFLIVEGDTDAKFYRQLIDSDYCQVSIARNRDMAIKVLLVLQKTATPGIIAIVDKDFDELNGTLPNIDNLFFTDTHDLETLLLRSPALDKLLIEFGSHEKLLNFDRDIREVLLQAGCSIGYLLWVSLKDGFNLKFEGIDFPKFIDETTLNIDEVQLIQAVKNKSQQPNLSAVALLQSLTAQKDPNHDRWQVCCGHHLIEILSFGLRKTLGTNKSQDIMIDKLEMALRLAYEANDFRRTALYVTIVAWEAAHPAYQVLKPI